MNSLTRIEQILHTQRKWNKTVAVNGKERITYRELYEWSMVGLDGLEEGELGNHIGIFLPNSIHYIVAYFSIIQRKKTVVPISIQSKGPEVAELVKYCELNVIVTDEGNAEQLADGLRGRSNNKIILFCIDTKRKITLQSKNEFACTRLTDENRDVCVMLHTSGTMGRPKRVMLTHEGLLSNIKANVLSLRLNQNDKCFIALPMIFGYCNTAQFLTHLYIGGSLVILDTIFTAKAFFQSVMEHRITNFTTVPTMLRIISRFRNMNQYDYSSLRHICFGGGNVSPAFIRELMLKMETVGFVHTYGLTEAGPRVTALLPHEAFDRLGSVGKPIPNVKVKVVDDEGNEVPEGRVGNVLVKSRSVMKGYYKRPETTRETIVNGWLDTGDLGYLTEGYLYLSGRKKNVIISGGVNVYPEEVEEVIMEVNGVSAVRVRGENDEVMGEAVVAEIVPDSGMEHDLLIHEVLRRCKRNLTNYKIPKRIEIRKELERTATGKIRR